MSWCPSCSHISSQRLHLHPVVQGEDEVRQSGVPFTVVRPCALTEEPAGADLVFSQGDTIKVIPAANLPSTGQLL